jgi:hypothetical protein
MEKEERMRTHIVGRSVLLFAVSVVALVALTVSAWSQAPLDPQALIGEWNGSWTNKKMRGINGPFYLKIEQVQGNKVYGQVEFSFQETVRYQLLGTLDGNRLTFGTQNPTELVIEGNRMRGSSQGSVRANPMDITLTKAK